MKFLDKVLKKLKSIVAVLTFFSTVLVTHELMSLWGWVDPFLLPPPSQVGLAFWSFFPQISQAFFATAGASFLGLSLSFVVAAILAVITWFSSWARKVIWPIALVFQTIPLVALAPLLVIWFGFGLISVVVSSFLVSFFPCLAAWIDGFDRAPKLYQDLFASLRATRLQVFLKLVVPSAVPSIYTGLRVSAALSVVGAIVGEFIAGGGLGSLIDLARTQSRVDLVFAAIMASSAWGLIFVSLIDFLRYFTARKYDFKG